ncbi:trimeric intracellular cation channel family protein [uncultured Clostridium sp.]|uniref:trimeric intracellular cation channel family protein n=1 Tax=uncultured Clostridium sp. TaxID=59620 RepID=UPI0028EB8861|nr:trimeric intracellular cation channel family protein [uncultured Clostridium sp.]
MSFMSVFEIVGTIAFALSGCMLGIKKQMDLFGTIVLAITTAVGGGVLRDILIGIHPPAAFVNPFFATISIITAVIVFICYDRLNRLNNIIQISDAIGLGAFAAIGCSVAIENNFTSTFIVVSLGLFTGVGGGILRDVFAQEIPFVFKKEIYAVACIVGGLSFVAAREYFGNAVALYVCFFVTFIVRIISIKCNLQLPKAKMRIKQENLTK